jgi:hypothetical protein
VIILAGTSWYTPLLGLYQEGVLVYFSCGQQEKPKLNNQAMLDDKL